MRPQQNNNKNRMRGRGRKPSGNTNRNFESNGPDVKIRGNAAHIAEKYTTLARDALSSGDRVIAENYLQHAEHYNRIVLANNAAREEAQANQARNQPSDRDNDQQPDVRADSDENDNGSDENAEREDRRPRRRNANGDGRQDGKRESRTSANRTDENPADDGGRVEAGSGDAKPDAGDEVQETPKPRARRTSRKKPETAEKITSDAAGLPQGLLGDAASRENAAADD
jgi:hypothetical protein